MRHAFTAMIVIALTVAAGLTIPHTKSKVEEDTRVPIVGITVDTKYPIYDLKGELDDLNYTSSEHTIYRSSDLPGNMGFLSYKDAKGPRYKCDFVCKDTAGHIVGLNPEWAKVFNMSNQVPKD